MKNEILKRVFLALMLILLYLPILILAVYSFTDATNIGAIRGFSLHNYVTLFTTPELTGMIAGTLALAFGSAAIATFLGTIGAIGSFYSKKRVSGAIGLLNQVPVVNADVVTGFSICILLVVVLGVSKDTFIPLVVGHVTLCAPFVYLSVMPKLRQLDPSSYEAALDLGATPFRALTQVVIPQLVPGIISGAALRSRSMITSSRPTRSRRHSTRSVPTSSTRRRARRRRSRPRSGPCPRSSLRSSC